MEFMATRIKAADNNDDNIMELMTTKIVTQEINYLVNYYSISFTVPVSYLLVVLIVANILHCVVYPSSLPNNEELLSTRLGQPP